MPKSNHSATASPPRKRTRLRPEDRRLQIVLEATRLISRVGFNAVSVADIADACGIRKASVLHHFPSMILLLKAVLAHWDAAGDTVTTRNQQQVTTPAAARATLTDVVKRNLLQPELVRLYLTLGTEALSPDNPAHSFFVDRHRYARQVLADMLGWKDDPAAAALELLAFWSGMEWHWLWNPDMDMLAIWSRFSERFIV